MRPDFKGKTNIAEIWYGKKIADKLGYSGNLNTMLRTESDSSCNCAFQDAFDHPIGMCPCNGEITSREKENGVTEVKCIFKNGITLFEQFETFSESPAIRQINTVKNEGTNAETLRYLSSARIQIESEGKLRWDHPDRFRLHLCRQGWATEGQWKEVTLRELGLGSANEGWTRTTVRLRSEGSWTTAYHYPILIIEDKEKNVTYFVENESGGTWEIQLGKMENQLYIDCNSCNSEHDGWFYTLKPQESFTARPAVYGMVSGGFTEAVKALNAYKRQTSLKSWKNGTPLVCFNDYMNGTTGKPHANIYEMITSAGEAGCEVFCIDAGWFNEDGENVLGDYYICDNRFAPYTFKDMIEHIKEMGMIPGVWFEFEAVVKGTELYNQPDCIRTRHGLPLGGDRSFYNLKNQRVRNHLMKFIRAVYDLGVRYIKNDYNQNTGIGSGEDGQNYSVESMRHTLAFYDFIKEIYKEFPDMIIENCGSGAMRSDNATLKHFTLQSVSDQPNYIHYPSILEGTLAQMPPEKAGIWGFTVPLHRSVPYEKADFKAFREQMINGEQMIFNMVNAMMGSMYLSGWLNHADDYNKSLAKSAVEVYKGYREMIGRSNPIFPMGFFPLGADGFTSVGLISETDRKLILAVWKIGAKESQITVPLADYIESNAQCRLLYPAEKPCNYCFNGGNLVVELADSDNMARLFEFRF